MQYTIRLEQPGEQRRVEEITRDAFWNHFVPGCDEHYLVHLLRNSPDFIAELNFVALAGDELVGSIQYSRSYVLDADNKKWDTITFGPLSVLPAYQGQGVGGALVTHSIGEAHRLGFRAVLIYGFPDYYRRFGFRHAKEFGISSPDGRYPAAHQALELTDGALEGISGKAFESPVFEIDRGKAEAFDQSFPLRPKLVTESQALFQKMAGTFL